MSNSATTLSRLSSSEITKARTGASNFGINETPPFGKGFIYAIDWGFTINRSSNYGAKGTYIGLTTRRVIERYKEHIKRARSLSYKSSSVYSTTYDTKKLPVSGVNTPSGEGRLMYIAMATSMGNTRSTLDENEAYRSLKVIAVVNLFDLAFTERKIISESGSISDKSFNNYSDVVHEIMNSNNKEVLFNASEGGEGSKFTQARMGGITKREIVIAAFYFLTEGRGLKNSFITNLTREVPGVYKNLDTLATDISLVVKHFKKTSVSYEKLNMNSAPVDIKIIKEMLLSLGFSESKKIEKPKLLEEVDVMLKISGEKELKMTGKESQLLANVMLKRGRSMLSDTELYFGIDTKTNKRPPQSFINFFVKKIKENPDYLDIQFLIVYKFKSFFETLTGTKIPDDILKIPKLKVDYAISRIKKEFPEIWEEYNKGHAARRAAKQSKSKNK